MDTKRRPSGIEGVGDISWGTHFCLFYETKDDLLDFFIPFFKVGLEHHEFCLCVASEPLIAEDAQQAMRKAWPDFERRLAEGQIEITPHTDWYLKDGRFDEQRVLQGWIDKLDRALAKGFSGVRFAANILLEKGDWESFAQYEGKLEETLHDLRIEGLCAYNLNRYSAANLFDVIRHHQFTLAHRDGVWEPLEGGALKHAHEEVLKLNVELEHRVVERTAQLAAANEQLKLEIIERKQAEALLHAREQEFRAIVENAPDQIIRYDRNLHRVYVNPAVTKDYGLPKEVFVGKPIGSIVADAQLKADAGEGDGLKQKIQAVFDTGEPTEYEVTWPLPGGRRTFWARLFPEFDQNGVVINVLGIARDVTERKRVEEELRYHAYLLENLHDAIIATDEKFIITSWNRAAEEMYGWTASEIVGENVQEVVHSEFTDAQREEALGSMRKGERFHTEVLQYHRDGKPIWVEGNVIALRDSTGEVTGFVSVNRDITERKQMEEALRESEEKFSAAFRASPIALVIATLDGKYVEMNQAFCELLGYSREELLGKTAVDIGIFNAETRQQWVEALAREGDAMTNRELSFQLRNGISRTTLSSVETITLHGVPHRLSTILDITERKQAEEALRRSESNFRTLAEKSLEGIQLYQGGRSVYANAAMTALMGYTQEELRAMSMEEHIALVHPLDRAIAVERASKRQAGQEVPASLEVRILTKAGATRWVQGFTNEIEYNGQPAIISTAIDITERKQTESELRTQKEILQKIFDHTPMMIGMISADGQWQMINRAWERTIGWTLEELQQPNFDVLAEVYPDPGEYQRVMDFIAAKSGKWEEFKVRVRDGRVLDVTFTNVYLSDGTTLGFGLDITERKQAEEAIRKSEQVLREAESLGHTGSWEQNLVTGEIFNTEENLRLFFGDDCSKGANFEDYAQAVHPDDHEYVLRRRVELLEEEGPSDIEYRVIWPDGSIHVIFGRATVVRNELGQAIRVYGTNVDITERKHAEEETKHQAERAETLARIAARLNKQLDLEPVIHAVCEETINIFKVSQATMSLYDKKRDLLVYAGGVNIPPEYAASMEPITRSQFDDFLEAMGPIMVVPDIQSLPDVPNAEFSSQLDVRTVVTAAMLRDQELIGVLVVGVNGHVREFDKDELTLLKAISDQAAQAIANALLLRAANEQHEQLRALSARLVEVQEAERRALTIELHDRVGQNLTGLSINLQNMKALLSDETAKTLAMKFDDAQALVEHTTRQIRDIMAELHPPELEDYGLAVALETYAERAASRGNLELIADLPDLAPPPLPSDISIALFRAAQEAISNVLKHANATRLEVSLEGQDGRIRLRVEDDGGGFEPDSASQKEAQTWGLKIMRERIESIGGKVQIGSEPGQGTRVVFEIERPS